jgi:hypothetical protein
VEGIRKTGRMRERWRNEAEDMLNVMGIKM